VGEGRGHETWPTACSCRETTRKRKRKWEEKKVGKSRDTYPRGGRGKIALEAVVGPHTLRANNLVPVNARITGRTLIASPAIALALGARNVAPCVAWPVLGLRYSLDGELAVSRDT
jgi:hypothetical protein